MSYKYYPIKVVFCRVCGVSYSKSGSHAKCYKSHCSICYINFDTTNEQIKHSSELHKENYCVKCCECVGNLRSHKINWCK